MIARLWATRISSEWRVFHQGLKLGENKANLMACERQIPLLFKRLPAGCRSDATSRCLIARVFPSLFRRSILSWVVAFPVGRSPKFSEGILQDGRRSLMV
jgi:hypothetical protein